MLVMSEVGSENKISHAPGRVAGCSSRFTEVAAPYKDEALQAVGLVGGFPGFTFAEVARIVFTVDLDECITELNTNGLFR